MSLTLDHASLDQLKEKVAWLYYVDGQSQQEIADRLRISRTRVWRLLQEAIEQGIVEIRINQTTSVNMKVVGALETKFGLKEAIVVNGSGNDEQDRNAIGKAAARFLLRILQEPFSLGVGVGLSVNTIAQYIQPHGSKRKAVVMGIAGGITYPEISSMEICGHLADRLGARVENIYAPFIVETPQARLVFMEHRHICEQFERAQGCSAMITGVGYMDPSNHFIHLGYIKPDEIQDLQRQRAVGEVMGRFFDINGCVVNSTLNQRLIGLDLEQIRCIPTKAIMAAGVHKSAAILGALRTNVFDVLITDNLAAAEILSLHEAQPGSEQKD